MAYRGWLLPMLKTLSMAPLKFFFVSLRAGQAGVTGRSDDLHRLYHQAEIILYFPGDNPP